MSTESEAAATNEVTATEEKKQEDEKKQQENEASSAAESSADESAPETEEKVEEAKPAKGKAAKAPAKIPKVKKAPAIKKSKDVVSPPSSPPVSKTRKAPAPSPASSPKAESKKPAAAAVVKKAATSNPSAHPPYLEMIVSAIETLKEKTGSSRAAILKYITANFEVGADSTMINVHIKQALKRGVATNKLVNTKVTLYSFNFTNVVQYPNVPFLFLLVGCR